MTNLDYTLIKPAANCRLRSLHLHGSGIHFQRLISYPSLRRALTDGKRVELPAALGVLLSHCHPRSLRVFSSCRGSQPFRFFGRPNREKGNTADFVLTVWAPLSRPYHIMQISGYIQCPMLRDDNARHQYQLARSLAGRIKMEIVW